MVYKMVWYVDGGCRRNGQPDAIGAAAAVLRMRYGRTRSWTKPLKSRTSAPTNQRAEITAIIMALQETLKRYDNLDGCPELNVTIHSDSQFAVNCMNEWIHKWCRNGWINAKGQKVANHSLIKKASDLDDRVKELGNVTYEWIPRCQNEEADQRCNEALDEQEPDYESKSFHHYDSSDSDYSSD